MNKSFQIHLYPAEQMTTIVGVQSVLNEACRQCLVRWFWENSQARSVPVQFGQPEASALCIGLTTSVRVRGHVELMLCSPTKENHVPRETHGSEGRRVAVDDAERMSSQLILVTPGNGSLVDARLPLRPGPNVTSSKTVRIRQFIAGERRTPSAACKVNSRSHKVL